MDDCSVALLGAGVLEDAHGEPDVQTKNPDGSPVSPASANESPKTGADGAEAVIDGAEDVERASASTDQDHFTMVGQTCELSIS